MTQPEALRLADELNKSNTNGKMCDEAAAELRRLHADNEKKSEAIQRLWKERDELRAQRDELLEALRNISLASQDSGSIREGDASYSRAAIGAYVRDVIAKAEGKT